MRRRIEMVDRGTAGPSQPYHAAVGLDIREAGQLVGNCAARAAALAATALRGIVEGAALAQFTMRQCPLHRKPARTAQCLHQCRQQRGRTLLR